MSQSWKPEVRTGTDPKFYSNAIRFKTETEAREYAADLSYRWTSVVDYRTAESDDPVNYTFHDGQLQPLSVLKPLSVLTGPRRD